MSKESVVTLIPALIMLGFAVFGASVLATNVPQEVLGH
jgi:hypothetical protein